MGSGHASRVRRPAAAPAARSQSHTRLAEACARPGCPVCRCLSDDSLRQLRALLYEHVTDPGIRGSLRRSRGFCAWHASLVGELSDSGFGSAIIAADVLGAEIARVERALARPRRAGRLGRLLRPDRPSRAPRAMCRVCEGVRAAERRHLDALLEMSSDARLGDAFDRSDGLCAPHVERLLETASDRRAVEDVARRAIARWRAILRGVTSFVDKHDHRNRERITDAEARSWRLALELLAGAPHVFGSDVRREAPGDRTG